MSIRSKPQAAQVLDESAPVIITGGAGFVGCNLAESFLREGRKVVVIDTLSRPGVEENLAWLREHHGELVHHLPADIREFEAICSVFQGAGAVFHLAAQTAVTTSIEDPLADFETNARGTVNVLEAVRAAGGRIPVIFASTNKVYGALDDLDMIELEDRYFPARPDIREYGIDEDRRLDFCTPYGCSKGVADQYVLDYAHSFDIPTAVLRMSCIYGPRQFGTEDQGWVAHFLIRALQGKPISIYGDGKQVRDILHVADAVAAYRAVLSSIATLNGETFNLGGGVRNAASLRMVLREISRITGQEPVVEWSDWRKGDQRYFVSDTRRLERKVGWTATIGWQDGLRELAAWLDEARGLRKLQRTERLTA